MIFISETVATWCKACAWAVARAEGNSGPFKRSGPVPGLPAVFSCCERFHQTKCIDEVLLLSEQHSLCMIKNLVSGPSWCVSKFCSLAWLIFWLVIFNFSVLQKGNLVAAEESKFSRLSNTVLIRPKISSMCRQSIYCDQPFYITD